MDIGSQTDASVKKETYSTYAWVKRSRHYKHADAKVDNDIVRGRIMENVNKEMETRGFRIDSLAPQLLMDFDILTEERSLQANSQADSADSILEPYVGIYSPFSTWPSPSVSYGTAKTTYENGTVFLYVADKAGKKLLWKAWADGSVENVRHFEEELPKDIHQMFRKFPLKAVR